MIARLRWQHGAEQDVLATAIAWTRDAVEVTWEMEAGEGLRADWIPALDVRRLGEAPKPVNQPPRIRPGASRPGVAGPGVAGPGAGRPGAPGPRR